MALTFGQRRIVCAIDWVSGWSASTVQRAYATKIQGIKRTCFFFNAHRVTDLAAFLIQSVAFLVQSIENEGWHQADFCCFWFFDLPNTSLWGVYLHNMNPSSTIRLVFTLIPTSFPEAFVHILNHITSTYYSFTCSCPILIQCKHSFIMCVCVCSRTRVVQPSSV